MSEIKRATLMPLATQTVDDKKCIQTGKTVRISFILPESNEDTCPEYNYKEELAAAKRKDKKEKIKPVKPVTNGLDPFNEEEDDDVRRIAQEMEAKYGVCGPKKKRKGRRDDYADIGMGYDESDSFIDNTDGYDEMIPQNVTTLHGGFYINSGALEFKTDDEASSEISSSSSDDEVHNSTARKRVLESSSGSEGEKETEKDLHVEKKPKLHTNGTNGVPKMMKKFVTPEKMKQLKKKRNDEKKKHPTVKELLREKREEDVNGVALENKFEELGNDEEPKDSMKENKKPMSLMNISDVIESVVRGVDEEINDFEQVQMKSENNDVKPGVNPSSDGENSKDSEDQKKFDLDIVKLPENLPDDIVNIITKIKEYASKNTEGKVRFFLGPVSDILLRLERQCKCLGKQSRMRIYEHLAPFIKCRKETLIRRAKNLVLEDDQEKIMSLQKRLKDEIDNVMPSLLETYEKEGQRIMQKKFSKESATNEENKQLRMPKRRFHWTEEIKKVLKEIVALRKRCFLLEGRNKDHLENLMNIFLKTEIHILWPEGWMSMSSLQKVCNNVLLSDGNKPSTTTVVKNSHVTSSVDTSSKDLHKITSNANLSITPVITNIQKSVNSSVDNTTKPRTINKSDITINRIDNKEVSVSKTNKALPEATKTTNALTIIPANTSAKSPIEKMERIDFIKQSIGNDSPIVIEESPIKPKPVPENNNQQIKHDTKPKIETAPLTFDVTKIRSDNNHCQIIDLTEQSEMKKKSSHKSKTKYYEGEKGLKCKNISEMINPKQPDKDELTGTLALNQLITESLNDGNMLPQFSKQLATHPLTVDTNQKQFIPSSAYSTTTPMEYPKLKPTNEGDDIQKVMEDLKVLQKLSSPVKNSESLTSSPVSVIAFNKNYSPKSHSSSLPQTPTSQPRGEYSKADFSSGFQEAFQRQLLNDFAFMQTSVNHSTPTSSKSHYNSSDKFSHTPAAFLNDKYYQASNNNYTPQTSGKMKNLPPQPGSYNILDDMLANFLTEYGYPKTANHIAKPPPK